MNIRFATSDEIDTWNHLLVANPDGGNIFQSHEIAQTKQLAGWTPRYVLADSLAITVLEKRVAGSGKLWYIPKGPGVTSAKTIISLISPLREFARDNRVFAVKIEPELLRDDVVSRQLTDAGLVPVRAIQPNSSTVVLDLSPSIDEILANLNQKGRHAIRRAERDGVVAVRAEFTRDNARAMYDLLLETAAGRWNARHFDYYYEFWKRFADNCTGQLFFAQYEDKLVAGAFCMYMGHKGTYKDGASIRERTAYGASHLLQWEAIKWMKEHDVISYDLCGTPPSDRILDESHPHYGLGRFKTSFNKHVTDYIGAFDLIVSPTKYKLWRKIGERAVIRLNTLLYGQYWY